LLITMLLCGVVPHIAIQYTYKKTANARCIRCVPIDIARPAQARQCFD